jgi:hypothetical protein
MPENPDLSPPRERSVRNEPGEGEDPENGKVLI